MERTGLSETSSWLGLGTSITQMILRNKTWRKRERTGEGDITTYYVPVSVCNNNVIQADIYADHRPNCYQKESTTRLYLPLIAWQLTRLHGI